MLPVISANPFESAFTCPSVMGPRASLMGALAGKLYIIAVNCELGYVVDGTVKVKPRETGLGMETNMAPDWEKGCDVL